MDKSARAREPTAARLRRQMRMSRSDFQALRCRSSETSRLDLTSRSPELTPSTACAGLADPGLEAIGEIIHDFDLKDANFDSDEASGIALLVKGIVTSSKDDAKPLERARPSRRPLRIFSGQESVVDAVYKKPDEASGQRL